MDCPGVDPALLRAELETLEAANQKLGAHGLLLQSIRQLLGANPPADVRVLDLGTGLADIPRAIAAWARLQKLSLTITAVDGNTQILDLARAACGDWPEIKLEQHDLRTLPYPPESFDLVLCSLALHHFSDADAVAVLRRIRELARRGCVVSDLRRNHLAILTAKVLALMPLKSHAFRHDALQSCRAAFSVSELRALARAAGWDNFQLRRQQLYFRMTLEAIK